MKKLLSALTFLTLSAHSAPLIFETTQALSPSQREEIFAITGSSSISSFFAGAKGKLSTIYEVEASKKDSLLQLSKLDFIKNTASDHQVEMYEIRPNPQSEMSTSDLLFPLQWALQNQGQLISTQRANGGPVEIEAKHSDIDWKNSIELIEKSLKKTPTVAVLDMGIDFEHPELKDQILKNDIECNDGNIQIGEREDRDGNGLFGDCMGWNFAATSRLYEAYPADDKGHGTHISGIIAAKKNNGLGISGVSDKIKILPIRVTGRIDETSERNQIMYRAASRRIAKGIYYAATRGVDVINLSLGWPKSMNTFYMNQAISFALSQNIMIVAAAGNNNTNADVYPCAFQEVVCVGSIDADGTLSRFSNYGGQVDILAPGNQILSTIPTSFIPLKMNIQGYDIMSGTSQAAPYVSAIAALLRSSFPKESIDETKRRMYDSAKPAIADKSTHGLIQLGAAFELAQSASIKPSFKDMNELIINEADMKSFTIPLYLKNIGLKTQDVKVELSSNSQGVVFEQRMFSIPEFLEKKIINLPFGVLVTDKNASNQFKFTVKIHYNENEYLFHHEVSLSKSLPSIANKEVLPLKFIQREQKHTLMTMRTDLPETQENKYNMDDRFNRLNLRSISQTYPAGNSSFYLSFNPKDKQDEVQIFIFNEENGQIVEKEKVIELKNVKSILSVEKMDYNYDGTQDYLVKTIGAKSQTQLSIAFHYFDENLNPLYKEASFFEYVVDNESVQIDASSTRYIKTAFFDSFIAVPVFANAGKIPLSAQAIGPWDKADLSVKKRVYTFNLKPTNTDVFTLEPKMVFENNLQEKLLETFSHTLLSSLAKDDASYEVVSMDLQTREDFYNNNVNVKISYGIGFQRSIIKAAISGGEIKLTYENQIRTNLIGSSLHTGFDLTSNTKYGINSYISFFTNSDILVSHIEGSVETKINYRFDSADDRLVSFIASYKENDSAYLFFETIDNILMVKNDSQGSHQSISPIKKFSFLPGKVMSDLFYAYTVATDEGKIPGIYIDSSAVSINRIYTMIPQDNKLHAPLDLSVSFPQVCGYEDGYCGLNRETNHFGTNFCMPLNPYETSRGDYGYSILCKYKDSFQVIKIKAQI